MVSAALEYSIVCNNIYSSLLMIDKDRDQVDIKDFSNPVATCQV